MTATQPTARISTDHLSCVLRADQIRTDTLTQLAAAWADPDTRADIETALDHLADTVQSPRTTQAELDAAVQAVDDAACMDYPQVRLSKSQTRQLGRDLGRVRAAWAQVAREAEAVAMGAPVRRGRGAA